MNKKWISKAARISGGLFLFAGVSELALADSVTFSTGEFLANEWFSETFPGLAGTSSSSTQAIGGNPGAFRRVSLSVAPFQSAFDAQLWNVTQFTPKSQGMVTSVSMSYDISRVFSSDPGATQVAKGIAVLQDGILSTGFLGISTASPPTWDLASVTDLVSLFPQVNWVNGEQITFGFFNSVSTSVLGFTIDAGYDNFQITVNFSPVAVPLPMSLLLLASGFGVLAPRMIRRTKDCRATSGIGAGTLSI